MKRNTRMRSYTLKFNSLRTGIYYVGDPAGVPDILSESGIVENLLNLVRSNSNKISVPSRDNCQYAGIPIWIDPQDSSVVFHDTKTNKRVRIERRFRSTGVIAVIDTRLFFDGHGVLHPPQYSNGFVVNLPEQSIIAYNDSTLSIGNLRFVKRTTK